MRLETEVSIFKKNSIKDNIEAAKSSARGVDVYQSASAFLNYTPNLSTQTFLPESITLTPTFTGGLTFGAWNYRLGNASALSNWISAVGANGVTISALHVLTIVPSSTLFTDSCSEIVFQCVDSTGAFAKTIVVSKQIDARSSYAVTNASIADTNDKIALIASSDELSNYTTTNTLASKQSSLNLTADGLLYNAVQSYSVVNNVTIDLYGSSKSYKTGDVVISGGKFYSSKSNNNVGHQPPNTTYWNDVSSSYTYDNIKSASNYISSTALGTTAIVCGDGVASEWATNKQYSMGDLVWHADNNIKKLYKCITSHTSTTFSADAAKWKTSVSGSVVDMFADGISLSVQSGSGSSSIDLASGILTLQTSDIANIIANNTLTLSSGTINIMGSGAINLGTSSNGVVTINSPNFSLNENGVIEATGGQIGDFSINYNGDTGLYAELSEPVYDPSEIVPQDSSIVKRYFRLSTSGNSIKMIDVHREPNVSDWGSGVMIMPSGIYLDYTDIYKSEYDSTLGARVYKNILSGINSDIDELKAKTRKSTSYVTSQITSNLKVYTHSVGLICFSHISGKSPTHAAGAVSSGYTAATGINCAIPTGLTTFDANGKRILFEIDSSGNISITKFIDAVSTSADIDVTLVWVASSYPPFT